MLQCRFCGASVVPGSESCPKCHAPVTGMQQPEVKESLEERVRSLLDDKQKLEAIKLYREETGLGLAEAKYAVELIEGGGSLLATSEAESTGLESEVLRLLTEGKKIQAIKLYRERTGVGLKEAKEAVEALGARHGIVSRSGGCLGLAALIVGIVAAVIYGKSN